MPGAAQDDLVARRHERSPPAARERAAREREVELGGRSHERVERLRLRRDERREVAEDPRHLVALGDLGLAQPVRVVDRARAARRTASGPSRTSRARSPGTRPRADALSASTGRPPRSVTKSSCRCSASAGSRAILRRRSASFPRPSRSSRRRRRSAGEAESLRSEPSSSTERPISSATESSDGSMPLDELQAAPAGRRARRSRGARPRRRGSSARSARGSACRACCRAPRDRPPRSRRRRRRGRARRRRRAARSPRSSAAGAGAPRRRRPTGGGASARSAPGSLAAAPASRVRTAGSSSSSRSCSRMRRVYGGVARCTVFGRGIRSSPCGTASRCPSWTEACCSRTVGWRRR